MTVYAPITENNVGLASAVNNRIEADGRLIRGQAVMLTAKAWLWRLGGLALLAVGIGAGVGLILFGLSYYNDPRTSADKMASAFAAALEHANLGTVKLDHEATIGVTGSVDMKPGVVTLAPGSTVTTTGTVTGSVALEPGGTVRVLNSDVLRPTERQLNGEQRQPQSSGSSSSSGTGPTAPPSSKTVTNYTIFKSVNFGTGSVKTGWDFATSEQEAPTRQYCYYAEESSAGMQVIMTLAQDGQLLDIAREYKAINVKAAASQCVWFNGQQTH